MEDLIFETGEMDILEANKFLKWFNSEIGTESEITESEEFVYAITDTESETVKTEKHTYTITFFSLDEDELEKVKVYEFIRKNGDITLEVSE